MHTIAGPVIDPQSRVFRHLPLLIGLISFGMMVLGSSLTGPAFAELPRLAAVETCGIVVRQIADEGITSLGSAGTGLLLSRLEEGRLLALLGAWSQLSIGRVGLLDPLTAMRLPWLAVAALGPVALFALVRRRAGPWLGVLAALALLGMPHFIHGAVVGDRGVTLASVALAAVLLAERGRLGPRRLGSGLWLTVLLGVALTETRAVLWVLGVLLLAHAWAERRGAWRRLKRGQVRVPTWILPALVVLPVLMIALDPGLWRQGPVGIARHVLGSLAVQIEPTLYGGEVVRRLPVPAAFGPLRLLVVTPLLVLLMAVLGAVVGAKRAWRSRLTPKRAPSAAVALCLLGLLVALPAVVPDVLLRFPPLVALGFPALALGFTIGLDSLAQRLGRRGHWACAVLTALVVVPTWASLPTAGSARSRLSAKLDERFQRGDGSELAVLAGGIDGLGRPSLSVSAPEVPADYFDALKRIERIETTVALRRDGADAQLQRGDSPRKSAHVTRFGEVLWSRIGP